MEKLFLFPGNIRPCVRSAEGKGILICRRVFKLLICLLTIQCFHTGSFAQCTPVYSGAGCSTGLEINLFEVIGEAGTSIYDSATGCAPGNYDIRTSESVKFYPDNFYSVGARSTTAPIYGNIQVFIDFNDDMIFSVDSETVGGANLWVGPGPAPGFFPISIPPGLADTGTHRMRVVVTTSASYPMINPCTAGYTIGEVHDYTAIITTPACAAITGLTADAISSTTATISWGAITGLGYEYVVDNSPADPAGSGTTTTLTSLYKTGLIPATLYYAHVKNDCGGGVLSAWNTIPFTTLHVTTGMSSANENDFNIVAYPNPATDIVALSISGNVTAGGKIELSDVSGNVLRTMSPASKLVIDMAGYPAGIYFLRYMDATNTKIIKIMK